MTLGGVLIQNYRAFGWLVIAASAVGGSGVTAMLLVIFRRRLFSRSVSRKLKIKNANLSRELKYMEEAYLELEDENANLRASWGQAMATATKGVSIILSGFGIDEKL